MKNDSRKGAKDAKFGEDILTADLRRLTQKKIYSPQRRRGRREKPEISKENRNFVCREKATDKKVALLRTIRRNRVSDWHHE